jgi:hypothetical protein
MKCGVDTMPYNMTPDLTIFDFLHSVISLWQLLKIIRLNDDGAIPYNPLRMHIRNQLIPNLSLLNLIIHDQSVCI